MSKTTPLVNGRVYQVKGSPDAVIKQAMDDAYAPSISTVDSAKYSTMSSDSYQSAILPQPCVITDRRVPRRLAHVADLHRACLMMQIKGDPSTISPAKKHWLVPIDTEPPSSPTPATSIPPTSTSDHPPIQFTPAWPTPNEYVLAVPHKPQNTITPRPGLEHSLSEEERMRLLDICQEKSDTWPEEYKRIKKEKKQAGSVSFPTTSFAICPKQPDTWYLASEEETGCLERRDRKVNSVHRIVGEFFWSSHQYSRRTCLFDCSARFGNTNSRRFPRA
jgi:hypothetical protein